MILNVILKKTNNDNSVRYIDRCITIFTIKARVSYYYNIKKKCMKVFLNIIEVFKYFHLHYSCVLNLYLLIAI